MSDQEKRELEPENLGSQESLEVVELDDQDLEDVSGGAGSTGPVINNTGCTTNNSC